MPLVIYGLGGRYTHTQTYRCASQSNFKNQAHAAAKNQALVSLTTVIIYYIPLSINDIKRNYVNKDSTLRNV